VYGIRPSEDEELEALRAAMEAGENAVVVEDEESEE